MYFEPAPIHGAWVIRPQKHLDDRGFFARVWCRELFAEKGMNPDLVQCNVSFNPHKGTLRGMHYQWPPHSEAKLIRCTRGRVYDVGIDLRPSSPSFMQWFGVELSAEEHNQVYLPEGIAHGYLTLCEDAEVFYQVSHTYVPSAGRGLRWDDPAFGVQWPEAVKVIAPRDAEYPDFDPGRDIPDAWR